MDDRFVWKASDIEFLSEEENRKELEKLRLYWQKRFLGKNNQEEKNDQGAESQPGKADSQAEQDNTD